MTYRKKKYNNNQSVKKVKSGKKTSVRRSRKRGGAKTKVIEALKEFYDANKKITSTMNLQTVIVLNNKNVTISATPTPAFLSLVLLMEVLTRNTGTPAQKTVVGVWLKKNSDLKTFSEEIVNAKTSKGNNGLSGGGKQRGGAFTNPQKISILGNYIALLKEFISIRRPYTFASYRIKHPGSVITGVNIKGIHKEKLKELYTKLSTGYSYVTLASLLYSQSAALASQLNELLFPPSSGSVRGSVQIFTKTFLKEIENLCNELDKLLFKVTKFLILPPPPIVAQPMNVEALGYVVVPRASQEYTVLPSQAQTQAEAAANLAEFRPLPDLYAAIADPIYFDVSAAGDAAGDAAGPEIHPRTLDRHISLFGADDVTLEDEEEAIDIINTVPIQSESLTPAQQTEIQNVFQSVFIQSLGNFKSVVNHPSLSTQGDVYTLLE